jgi:hypothetical protein
VGNEAIRSELRAALFTLDPVGLSALQHTLWKMGKTLRYNTTAGLREEYERLIADAVNILAPSLGTPPAEPVVRANTRWRHKASGVLAVVVDRRTTMAAGAQQPEVKVTLGVAMDPEQADDPELSPFQEKPNWISAPCCPFLGSTGNPDHCPRHGTNGPIKGPRLYDGLAITEEQLHADWVMA